MYTPVNRKRYVAGGKWIAITSLAMSIALVHAQARSEPITPGSAANGAQSAETVPAQSEPAARPLERDPAGIASPVPAAQGSDPASADGGQDGETAGNPQSRNSDPATLDTVTVTGSRIRRPEAQSAHPLSMIDKKQVESLSTANVVDLLNRQPQLTLGTDSQVNIRDSSVGGDKNAGVAVANLRGLGSTRTLVLINGRRQVAGTTASSAVDLNTISKTSLERVEVVTGGSSAVYGADAIAGVINLMTRQGFDGLVGQAQAGSTEDGGGDTRSFGMTFGKSFADYRGNVMLSLNYDKEDPIYWIQRRWGIEPGGKRGSLSYVSNPDWSGEAPSVPRFIPMFGVSGITYRQFGHPVITTAIGSSPGYTYSFDDSGNLIPFDLGTRLTDSSGRLLTSAADCPDCYVRNHLSTARNDMKRVGAELQASYSFLEDGDGAIRSAEGFFEGKHYEIESTQLHGYSSYAGSGPSVGTRSGGYAIRIDNPFAPVGLVDLMRANGLGHVDVTRINNDFGQDVDALRAAYAAGRPVTNLGAMLDMSSEYRLDRYVTGLRGTFSNDWNYEVYGNYGRTRSRSTSSDFMESLFRQQIDAVRDPDTGQIVCRSSLADAGNGCVPINIMDVGSISMADLAYSYRRPVLRDTITQTNLVASVDGTLFNWNSLGSGVEMPVGFAAGVEYRRESAQALADEDGLSGDLFYLGKKVVTDGAYSSWEAFAEVNLPLLQDVRFAKSLEVSASYRYQNYTTTGSDGSYGFSASWMPTEDFKVRSAFARAVRAPNIEELYSGVEQSVANITDPCDIRYADLGPAPQNRTANCRQILGDAADDFLQTPNSKWVILQGNTGLDAEVADTVTAGVVLTPRGLPNLTLTADYFTTKIDGVITSISPTQIAQNCVDSPTLDNPFCASVDRDVSGNISVVVSQVFNLAQYRTSGWDFSAAYAFDLPGERGRVSMNANATRLKELVYDPVPSNPTLRSRLDRTGTTPTWRGNFSTRYEKGRYRVDWNVRHLGSIIRSWNDKVGDYSMTEAHPKSGSFTQNDLRFGIDMSEGAYQVYFGIDNVFNRYAPMKPFSYLNPMYPINGRSYYAGVKVSF